MGSWLAAPRTEAGARRVLRQHAPVGGADLFWATTDCIDNSAGFYFRFGEVCFHAVQR